MAGLPPLRGGNVRRTKGATYQFNPNAAQTHLQPHESHPKPHPHQPKPPNSNTSKPKPPKSSSTPAANPKPSPSPTNSGTGNPTRTRSPLREAKGREMTHATPIERGMRGAGRQGLSRPNYVRDEGEMSEGQRGHTHVGAGFKPAPARRSAAKAPSSPRTRAFQRTECPFGGKDRRPSCPRYAWEIPQRHRGTMTSTSETSSPTTPNVRK